MVTFVYRSYHERFKIDAGTIEEALKKAQERREAYFGGEAEITCIKKRHGKEEKPEGFRRR